MTALARAGRIGVRIPAWMWPLLASAAFMAFALAAVAVFGAFKGEPPAALLRDPATHFKFPWYGGLVSSFGIVIMAASAAVMLLALSLVRDAPRILAAAAALTVALTLDDLVMLHDSVLPRLVGIPEKAVVAGYGLAFLAMFWTHGLRAPGWGKAGFYVALVLMAVSVLIDFVEDQPDSLVIAEDVAKAGAFAAWAAYWALASRTLLAARLRPPLS